MAERAGKCLMTAFRWRYPLKGSLEPIISLCRGDIGIIHVSMHDYMYECAFITVYDHLMECMENCGEPQSTVMMPLRVARMGPTVLSLYNHIISYGIVTHMAHTDRCIIMSTYVPQPESDRTENSCTGTPSSLAHSRKYVAEAAEVA